MTTRKFRIVITGAESTGKTWLTENLATHYHAKYYPEPARSYIEKLKRPYTKHDVEIIARNQIELIREAEQSPLPIIFFDTWLLITKGWFQVVYNEVPVWLENAITEFPVSFFLVCNTDIPWVFDPVRENPGEKRRILHQLYLKYIHELNTDFAIIGGMGEARLQNAIKELDKFLK